MTLNQQDRLAELSKTEANREDVNKLTANSMYDCMILIGYISKCISIVEEFGVMKSRNDATFKTN